MAKKGKLTGKNAKSKVKNIEKKVKDKTFGMKNKKKSRNVQNLVKTMAQAESGGYEKLQNKIFEEKKRKKLLEKEQKLLGNAFGKVIPKKGGSKICAFFKAGLCKKGKKCKFSHSDGQTFFEGKKKKGKVEGEKIDLYTDQRDILFGNKDVIDNWNQQKLSEVVDYNSSKYINPKQTDKICKNFLEAVEKKTYGWLWMCPNGHNCAFSHCLPKGYVFKSQRKQVKKVKTNDTLIQDIDDQRDKLCTKKLTPVTKELFFKWLAKRKIQKEKERQKRIDQDLKDLGIKISKKPTGRELFEKTDEVFEDAEGAMEEYDRVDKNKQEVEIDKDAFEDEELPDF